MGAQLGDRYAVNDLPLSRSRWNIDLAGHRAVLIVVFLHLALVVPLAATLNIWIDEAYTLQSTGAGVGYAVQRALGFESQPPLYFVLLSLWRVLNESLFFARLFSIVCTALTVYVAAGLARRFLPDVPSAVIAAVVGFNPLTVYAAVEARFYAMALLLSAALLLLLYDGYLAPTTTRARRLEFTAVAVVALYTHYFLGFYLAAGGAVVLLLRNATLARQYFLSMAATAICFVPLAAITARQVEGVARVHSGGYSLLEGARFVWARAWGYLFPAKWNSPLALAAMWLSRASPLLLVVAAVWGRRIPSAAVTLPTVLTAVVSGFFILVAVRLGPEFLRMEHTTVLYLPVLLGASGLLNYVGGSRAVVLAAAISLAFAGAYLFASYSTLSKYGDWIRVSQYIERYESPSEPILVFRGEFALDFKYHYSGINRIVPVPRSMGEDKYDLSTQVLDDRSEIERLLQAKLKDSKQFWLVLINTKPFRGVDFHPEVLDESIASCCRVVREKNFRDDVRVKLIALRQELQ